MIINAIKKIFFVLFLFIFSCSECQQQNKNRALYWLNKTYGNNTSLKNENLFSYALKRETGIKNRLEVIEKNINYPVIKLGSIDYDNNCVKLLQCALMYKGYYSGSISGKFDNKTAVAVMRFKRDAFGNNCVVNSNVTPLSFVAIVEKGDFAVVPEGDRNIRKIQQYLNRNYSNRCSIMTTDGQYGKRTHFTIIQGFQIETNCEKADGRFDEELTEVCPTLSKGMRGKLIYLLQCALFVNEVKIKINGIYDANTVKAVKQFQRIIGLSPTGIANMRTIKGLLTSTGDTSRPSNACDCYFQLSYAAAKALYEAGYRFVGRYLTGTIRGFRGKLIPKYIDVQEFRNISKAGLRIFPIFQEKGGHDIASFCVSQGQIDANIAIKNAKRLGFAKGTVIYFSVDCDPSRKQIIERIIPYFKKVNRILNKSGYKVGVYGTRLTCSAVSEAGYAKYSFVNDCSSRCDGNIGQPIPKNWAFDQFFELKGKESFKVNKEKFNLDKVMASGRDNGVVFSEISR